MKRNKGEEVRESATYARAKDEAWAKPAGASERVPRLRFPEFKSAGEWETKRLARIASLVDDRVIGRTLVPLSVMSGVGLIPQTEKFGREIAGSQYKNYTAIKKFDFAYNKSSTKQYPEGFIAMLEDYETAAVPPSIFTCFRITDSGASPFFLKHIFYANFHGNWLRKYIAVGARAHGSLTVDDSDLLKLPICFPGFAEQQKIAACLSSLDNLIAAHARKLETLRKYKKGLMQQVFPSEGEKVPRLRFADFENTVVWSEDTLLHLCIRIMDGTHFSPTSTSGPYMYLTSKNIRFGYMDLSNTSFISEEEHRQIYLKCPVMRGDILLTKDGANTGNCAINKLTAEFSLLSSVAVLRGMPAVLNQEFLFQVICSDEFQKGIRDSISGQAITRITLEKIGNYAILFPSLLEQQKIAACLSSLDDLIAAESAKLDELKEHKRGLMQGLFPSPDEES